MDPVFVNIKPPKLLAQEKEIQERLGNLETAIMLRAIDEAGRREDSERKISAIEMQVKELKRDNRSLKQRIIVMQTITIGFAFLAIRQKLLKKS